MEQYNNGTMKKGFTLMELLVAMTFFAIVITSFLGLFTSVFKEQKRNIAVARLLNAASYATEYMGRALRMAQKDEIGSCLLAGQGYSYDNTGGDETKVRFLNHYGECQELFLYQNPVTGDRVIRLKRSPDALPSWAIPAGEDITPTSLLVENLNFRLEGEDPNESPNRQPRVTIVLRLATKGPNPEKLEFQTTISQRELDVPIE